MRRAKTALIVALLLVSALPFVQKAEAALGEAKVFIICLNGVPGYWVDNCSRVKDGAIEACMVNGPNIELNSPRVHPKRDVDYPPYYKATPYVVTGWSQYENIVKSYSEVIVVNTHGEYLPIPSNYHNNKTGWVDEIADALLNRRVTWVHVGGYPFYRVWYQQTGTWEEWGEQGFKHLMSHINKDDVDCWPPSGCEDELATFSMGGSQQLGLSWFFNDGNDPITKFHSATLGRPLKMDDFKEYLIMPLFKYQDYYAGAVIAFAEAGARYTDGHGCGAYVHIGARYLYTGGGNPLDADYGRGFIGTAAALWAESMGFNGGMDVKSCVSLGGQNASLLVHPSISGVRAVGSDLIVTMVFAIYGVTQAYEGASVSFDKVNFFIDEVSGGIWSDVTMRVDLGFSREGYGDGLVLSGLYDGSHATYGLVASGIMWYLGGPELLKSHPIAATILWGVKGVMLLAKWAQQGCTANYSGVGPNFDPYIWFQYKPMQNYTTSDGKIYYEFMTLTTVELKILTNGMPGGWHVLPLSYNISALATFYSYWEWLNVSDTLEIAIWFEGVGQSDAGSNRDASNSNPVSVAIPESYHGYLGGGDNEDWYTFNMESGKSISICMTPPPFVDFDLELRRQDGSLKNASHQGAGITDIIQCTTDCGGTWKLKIYKVQGSGVYSFSLGWQYLTVKTKKTTGADISNVKIWIDSALYYSPVTISLHAGTYTLQAESYFSRGAFDFTFDHWSDGETSNPRTLYFNGEGNMSLIAYYKAEYQGTCPTLFVWNGSQYVYETLLNIHAESDITVQHQIQQTLVLDGMFYKLQLRELDNFTSHIDQVKLYAIDHNGTWHNCPLTLAEHNNTYITLKLLLDDDKRIDLEPTQIITLKFTPSIPYQKTAYFIFEINGHNRKIP